MMLIGFLLIGLVIYMLYSSNHTGSVSKTTQSIEAIEIAKTRLAKGEITIEEFEMLRKAILK